MSHEQEIKEIAVSIHSKLANLKNVQNALQREKLRNSSLVRKIKRAKILLDDALTQNTLECDICGFEAVGKEGLRIHKGRVHKKE